MIEVVGIKFQGDDNIYYYNPQGINFEKGEKCLVETRDGEKEAEIVLTNFYVEPDKIYAPLRKVLKSLTDKKELFEQKKLRMEKKAWDFCAKRIEVRQLPMRLVDVKYTEDLKKVTFYFVAENRVDFRQLLKDLVKTLRVKIELRQISRREYAKNIGGIGICGREVCCKSFLKNFCPITIKMAKMQGLPLNPSKISGICGRLLCCISYEKYETPVKSIVQELEIPEEPIDTILEDDVEEYIETDINWSEEIEKE